MAAAKKVLRYLESRKKIPFKWCALDNAAAMLTQTPSATPKLP
jgi:hypothetical protein